MQLSNYQILLNEFMYLLGLALNKSELDTIYDSFDKENKDLNKENLNDLFKQRLLDNRKQIKLVVNNNALKIYDFSMNNFLFNLNHISD